MNNPCELCMERDFCRGEFPCQKRLAFLQWKEKADQIREYTKQIMERGRK